jgi:MYXO-CTERM domain-containing protein
MIVARSSAPLLATVLLLGSAQAAPGLQSVQYTPTAVQVGGDLSQFPAASTLFVLQPKVNGPSDNTSTFYGLWDDQHLYLGVRVSDTALYCGSEPPDSQNMWDNDGVELNFDTKNKKALAAGDKDFRQWILPINWQGNPYDAYGSGATGDTSFASQIAAAFTLDGTLNDTMPDKGYSVIIRIPWSDLDLAPANGLAFGFDAAINDIDEPLGSFLYQDWAVLSPFAQPDKWGQLTLTGKGTPPPLDVGTPKADAGTQPRADGVVGDRSWAINAEGPGKRPAANGCDCSVGAAPATGWLVVLGLGAPLGLRRWRARSHRRPVREPGASTPT